MPLLTTCQPMLSQSLSCGSPQPTPLVLQFHNCVASCRTALWPVQVICAGSVPSGFLAPQALTARAVREAEKLKHPWLCAALLSNNCNMCWVWDQQCFFPKQNTASQQTLQRKLTPFQLKSGQQARLHLSKKIGFISYLQSWNINCYTIYFYYYYHISISQISFTRQHISNFITHKGGTSFQRWSSYGRNYFLTFQSITYFKQYFLPSRPIKVKMAQQNTFSMHQKIIRKKPNQE